MSALFTTRPTWQIGVMGLYSRYVWPRILDLVMRNRDLLEHRAKLVSQAAGEVVELGIGSGLNLPHYTSGVKRLFGVDPSPGLLEMARMKAAAAAFPVELVNESAERLPFSDRSIDDVVVTWSLCSIPDPSSALGEARRVLRPGGRLLFAEHGLSPDAGVEKWQNRLNPLWRRISGGCNMNRRIADLITRAGFRIGRLDTSYLRGPKVLTYTYEGFAE